MKPAASGFFFVRKAAGSTHNVDGLNTPILISVSQRFRSKMRAYDSWKLVQIQRGRATVTGFSANRKSDLGVVYLFF